MNKNISLFLAYKKHQMYCAVVQYITVLYLKYFVLCLLFLWRSLLIAIKKTCYIDRYYFYNTMETAENDELLFVYL